MKDIKSTTQKKYTDYSKSPGSPDNDFLFMYSVYCVLSTKWSDASLCSFLVYAVEYKTWRPSCLLLILFVFFCLRLCFFFFFGLNLFCSFLSKLLNLLCCYSEH
uniref:Uncharacterized protein n=1 Tax=Meleagris gallopavo TaxID=9103 RepID=A0A803YFH3_MELGA